jgi:hypothetical protein
MSSHNDRFVLNYDAKAHRRVVGGKEVIIHCHHYNARLQNTIESVTRIDGKAIIVEAAEAVFHEHAKCVLQGSDSEAQKWEVVAGLYAHLGFGCLDLGQVANGVVTAPSSHYVEGWATGFREHAAPVCSFTTGFLQGAIAAVTGAPVRVREVECANCGGEQCRFEVESRSEPIVENTKAAHRFVPRSELTGLAPSNIDSKAIEDAIVGMPIVGNEDGLIPAFGVYLANTPADYYNRICLRFLREMRDVGEGDAAKQLLLNAGETCAMNTFRGIMASTEWEGLIAPMIQETADELFALVALSNAFGWGNWGITQHEPDECVRLESLNGYEAFGALEYAGECGDPQCYMLTGVATGMMELIYSTGLLGERFGTFAGDESACIAVSSGQCEFEVEAA